jgi:UDP-glucose 4-epimerase
MKIAVTGGTGCLGVPLVQKLLDLGCRVRLLVLPGAELPRHVNKAETVFGSLNSPIALDELVTGCETVFHLAGKVHATARSQRDIDEFYRINVEGTRSLLEAAGSNNVKRVVFYSTVGVYGEDCWFHGDEYSPCGPKTVYAQTKAVAERLVLEASEVGGPQGVVLRFPVVYGAMDRGNVAALIRGIRSGYFLYFGNKHIIRSMVSSVNAAQAAILAAFDSKAAGEIFCVTDGIDHTFGELVEAICCTLGTNWRPRNIPLRHAQLLGRCGDLIREFTGRSFLIDSDKVRKLSGNLTFSCKKARDLLGYKPEESLMCGIAREVEWLGRL